MKKQKFNCQWCKKEVFDWVCRKRFTCSRSCQIKMANTGIKRSKIWDNLDIYIKDYNSGMTFKEICRKYGVSSSGLQRIFSKAGIKTRRIGIRNGKIAWNKGKENKFWQAEKNPNWKGGITPTATRIRTSREYKKWLNECLKRDNWTCLGCKKRGGDLNVDHYPMMFCEILRIFNIKSYKQGLKCEKFWDLDNGRTLCVKCHRKTFKFTRVTN